MSYQNKIPNRSHGRRISPGDLIKERINSPPHFGPIEKAKLADYVVGQYGIERGKVNGFISSVLRAKR